MDESLNQNHVVEMNAFQKCINIFFSPKQTHQSIERRSDLALPLILIAIMAIIVSLVTVHLQMTDDTIKRDMENAQIKMFKKMGMSDQQISEALEKGQAMGSPILKYGGAIFSSIIITAIFVMLTTFILWVLGNWILKNKVGFDKMLAVFAYSGLIKYVGGLLTIPLIIMQKDLKAGFHLANILEISGGNDFLSTFFYSIAMNISLFDIWTLIVLAIGMAVIYKSVTAKAGIIVFSVWAFFVLLFAVGMAAITSLIGFNPLMMS